jgi:hypothetical protein
VPDHNRRRFLKKLFAAAATGAGGAALLAANPTTAQQPSTSPHLNVRDYGARGDATTIPGSGNDDGPAFQAALNAAGSMGGGIVVAPRGNYRIGGTLTIPANVTLEGIFTAPTAWSEYTGTTLLAYSGHRSPTSQPFITLRGPNSTLKGLTIFYPRQDSTIVPYPWTIRGGDGPGIHDNLTIQDVLLVNPYQAVDFATYECGRHLIRGLYGYPLQTGIVIDKCFDIGRIENIHFWPFWNNSNQAMMTQIAKSAVALILKRSDWQIVHNFFAFGYHVGVQLVAGAGNMGTNGQFSNLNLDATNVGIDIYSISPAGIQISNLNATGTRILDQDARRAIWAHANPNPIGPLTIHNGSFWGDFANEIILWEQGAMLQVSSSLFNGWQPGNAAIRILGGRAIIQGNCFADRIGRSVAISAQAQQVVVTGNQLLDNPIESYGHEHQRLINNNL